MATTLELLPNAGGTQTLMSTELNAAAAGALVLGSSAFDNINATSKFNGYPSGRVELYLPAPASSFNPNCTLQVWWLRSLDGANFEDGSTLIRPYRPADVLFYIGGSAAAQRLYGVNGTGANAGSTRCDIPVGSFKPLMLVPNLGAAFAATLNTLKILTDTDKQL